MTNVVDLRPRTTLTNGPRSAIADYIRSFAGPAPSAVLTDARPALKIKAWADETVERHGAEATVKLLEFQLDRLRQRNA